MKWHTGTASFSVKTPEISTNITSTADICPNRAFTVRVYNYHPLNHDVSVEYSNQTGLTVNYVGQGAETITETVKYSRGNTAGVLIGTLSKTPTDGNKTVYYYTSDMSLFSWFEPVTYLANYDDFEIISTEDGNKAVLFYFAGTPNEAETLFEFTVAECACDAQNLDQCATQQTCEAAGGYWYGSACHEEPESPSCSLAHPEACLTQETCEAINGLYWWDGACHNTPAPTTTITIIAVSHFDESVVLSGATVYLDGTSKGTTDSNGRINIADVTSGTHTIKITKTGYQDTDADNLANDEISVTI